MRSQTSWCKNPFVIIIINTIIITEMKFLRLELVMSPTVRKGKSQVLNKDIFKSKVHVLSHYVTCGDTCSCTTLPPLTYLIPLAFSYILPGSVQYLVFIPYVKIFSLSPPLFINSSKWVIIVFSLKFQMYSWWRTALWFHTPIVRSWIISLKYLVNIRPTLL